MGASDSLVTQLQAKQLSRVYGALQSLLDTAVREANCDATVRGRNLIKRICCQRSCNVELHLQHIYIYIKNINVYMCMYIHIANTHTPRNRVSVLV